LKSLDDSYYENVTSEIWVIICEVLTEPAKRCTAHCKSYATPFFPPPGGGTQEFCWGEGGGGSTNSVKDRGQRERGFGGGSPLVRGSGGSCNFVQEISFHIVTVS